MSWQATTFRSLSNAMRLALHFFSPFAPLLQAQEAEDPFTLQKGPGSLSGVLQLMERSPSRARSAARGAGSPAGSGLCSAGCSCFPTGLVSGYRCHSSLHPSHSSRVVSPPACPVSAWSSAIHCLWHCRLPPLEVSSEARVWNLGRISGRFLAELPGKARGLLSRSHSFAFGLVPAPPASVHLLLVVKMDYGAHRGHI